MLSDFGTSRDMMQTPGARSGNSGTSVPTTISRSGSLLTSLVSNTVLQNRFPSHAQHLLSDRFKVCYVVSWHDPTQVQLLSFPASLGSAWRPSRALPFRPRVASPNEDDDGKGNDMDRLEREVSSYPGFKSTPRLETLFRSRRLHRSYLVLVESLFNVALAAVRPSCEKVLAASHLGLALVFTSSLFTTHVYS